MEALSFNYNKGLLIPDYLFCNTSHYTAVLLILAMCDIKTNYHLIRQFYLLTTACCLSLIYIVPLIIFKMWYQQNSLLFFWMVAIECLTIVVSSLGVLLGSLKILVKYSLSTIFFNRPWWLMRICMQLLFLFHIHWQVRYTFFFNINWDSTICTRNSSHNHDSCGRTCLCGSMSDPKWGRNRRITIY